MIHGCPSARCGNKISGISSKDKDGSQEFVKLIVIISTSIIGRTSEHVAGFMIQRLHHSNVGGRGHNKGKKINFSQESSPKT